MEALKDAPAHRMKETVDLLSTETPAFITPTLWPPNSPDLNPVDYKIWLVIQEQVRSTMLMSCASVSRLYGMNLISVLLTRRSSSGTPA